MSLITFKTEKGINLKIQPFCVFAFLQNLEKKASFQLISYLKLLNLFSLRTTRADLGSKNDIQFVNLPIYRHHR